MRLLSRYIDSFQLEQKWEATTTTTIFIRNVWEESIKNMFDANMSNSSEWQQTILSTLGDAYRKNKNIQSNAMAYDYLFTTGRTVTWIIRLTEKISNENWLCRIHSVRL